LIITLIPGGIFVNNRDEIIKVIKRKFPDQRTNQYRIRFYGDDNSAIYCEVDSEGMKKELMNTFKEELGSFSEITVRIMGEELPDKLRFGQVTIPVVDVRKDPRFRSERVRQLIFGDFVTVLQLGNEYTLVKDFQNGYIGYVNSNAITFADQKRVESLMRIEDKTVFSRFARLKLLKKEQPPFWIPMGAKLKIKDGAVKTAGKDFQLLDGEVRAKDEIRVDDLNLLIRHFYGTPYLWGGSTVLGTDCSGFVGRLAKILGKPIPRDADQQEQYLDKNDKENLSFGDLIFFPGHVGMYIGNETMAHANVHHGFVCNDKIFNADYLYGFELEKKITSFRKLFR